ncbi:MAG: HAD hydrolase-like protein [Prevotella sp.]|nr:HAD hydrolase-like protein [Prevotella sp.]
MQEAIKNYLSKHGFERFEPKAVLFDMDGVLYNSMPNHAKAWQQAMAKFGITMTANDAYATEGARGIDTIRQIVRTQQEREISEEEAQIMYDEKTRLFHEMPEAKIFYGVRALMSKIKTSGLQIGVVTGSGQRPLINRLLTDFEDFLDINHLVTAYDVSEGKPRPTPYLVGMKKAGNLEPWQTVVIENAPLGIHSAVAAKCFTIAINSGPLNDEILLAEQPDLLFDHINHLSRIWFELVPPVKPNNIKLGSDWEENCQTIINYMLTYHRRPSKHRHEDLQMLNWMKYNKKRLAHGKMPLQRRKQFQQLLDIADKYRRINQYWTLKKAQKMAATKVENNKETSVSES